MKSITITRTGEPEKVDPSTIAIPDMWHLAMNFRDAAREGKKTKCIVKLEFLPEQADLIADAILETWHTANQLKKAVIELPDTNGQPAPEPPKQEVIIRIDGGVADLVARPDHVSVVFRDYDNGKAAEEGDFEKDEEGHRYQAYRYE